MSQFTHTTPTPKLLTKKKKVEYAAGHELKEKVVEAKRVKGVELGKRARASAQMALAKRKARHTE